MRTHGDGTGNSDKEGCELHSDDKEVSQVIWIWKIRVEEMDDNVSIRLYHIYMHSRQRIGYIGQEVIAIIGMHSVISQ
jgi:hypothetical protein